MKLASWASRAISALIVCCGVNASSDAADASSARSFHIVRAELALVSPGQFNVGPPRQLGTLPNLTWQPIDLPHARPRVIVPDSIDAVAAKIDTVTAWYRIVVPSSQVNEQFTALYLPRWHTWGDLAIYVDDALIYSSHEENVDITFNRPVLVRLPFAPNRNAPLIVHIRMDSVRISGGALSTLWLGPFGELRPRFETRTLLQNRVPLLASATFLIVGLFSLGIWARRRETMYLLFFLLSVLVFLRNLHYYLESAPLLGDWLAWITINSLGWLMIVVYAFGFRLHGRRYPITERVLVGSMLIASGLSLPLMNNDANILAPLTNLIYIVVGFGATSLLTFASMRSRSVEGALLSGALWLNLALGVHDWLLQNWRIDIEQVFLMPFGTIVVSGLFLVFVLRRYLSAMASVEEASVVLETKLAARERELNESHARLREVEQAQLLSQERQRLMRDMHDGVGSALMSSLLAVERGQLQSPDVAQVLRECVDDLKLTIDSLEPIDDDLLVLLATLRYRLEPRLVAAGLTLAWHVGDLPRLAWLNPTSALQILRMLQEVLTNILKHAQAKVIRVSTHMHADHVVIAIADDGIGFDTQQSNTTGRGLGNLTRRAIEIGGRTEIDSRPGGTTVTLRLPLVQSALSR